MGCVIYKSDILCVHLVTDANSLENKAENNESQETIRGLVTEIKHDTF